MMNSATLVFSTVALVFLISCAKKNQELAISKSEVISTISAITPAKIRNSSDIQLAKNQSDEARFARYIETLKIIAKQRGISEATINKAFTHIYWLQRVIQSDKNQLEKKITLDEYLKRVLTKKRIAKGRENYAIYREQLARQAKKYQIPAQYIVALWGMESSYGSLTGKENIISAMASLAFEGRRETFFVNQLMDALSIIEQGDITPEYLKGSWAGAMGQCQFMPSSYIKYAADGDGDGIIDIWNNIDDVFASTANYLAMEGWDASSRWGTEITLPNNFDKGLIGLDENKAKTVSEWQKKGVDITIENRSELTKNAWIIMPDDLEDRAFLVFNNFNVLMHWNRSYYFALSVSMLADKIIEP